jgi:CRP-like cAMP-binding protein
VERLQDDAEALRAIPLLAGLPLARLKLIAYTAEALRFAPGEVLMRQGDPADAVYLVTAGEAEVSVAGAGGAPVVVRSMGPGALFGETAVLARTTRTATVTARTEVAALRLSDTLFAELLDESPELARAVLVLLAERLASERQTRSVRG